MEIFVAYDWNPFQSCSLPLPVKIIPVNGKFNGFKLDHLTKFYGKTAVFTPKLQGFFNFVKCFDRFLKNCNLAVKPAIFS
jgi:hypothetical protein